MATFPHEIDPVTGNPRVRGPRGNELGMEGILSSIKRLEEKAVLPSELQRLQATSIAGQRGRSSQVIGDIAAQLRKQNLPFRAEMLGGSTVRFSLLGQGGKAARGVGIGASFDVPLQIGGMVKGLPQYLNNPEGVGYQEAVRMSEFIGRGRFVRMGEKVVPATWIESVGYGIQRELSSPAVGDQGLRDIARNIQKLVTGEGYQGLVWAGAQRLPVHAGRDLTEVMASGYYARQGSIYDLFQMGTVGIHRGPGISAPKLIEEFADQSKFPFQGRGGQTFDPALALRHVGSFLQEAEALGIQASDRAIKAEAALAGNLGIWKLGEIVPFGETADPSRQAYQRLAIAQLAGRRGRHIAPVTTPVVEAMKQYVSEQTGQKARWTVESRLALVLDPRFEQAVAGSGGGAIITKGLQRELAADYTQLANFESARWMTMLEKGSGRAISPADIGTPVITSLGTKHTIAGVHKMKGARMAIGWSTFLKGKSPEAMREAVIRDVLDQMSQQPRGKGGQYIKSSLEDRLKFQKSLYEDIGQIFKGKMLGVEEGIPQLQVAPDQTFSTAQLTDLNKAISRYNSELKRHKAKAEELGLREIRKGFEISTLRIGGQRFRSMFVQASVMRRLEAAEIVTKAVGNWTRPAQLTSILGFKDGVEYFATKSGQLREVVDKLYNPRGIKMGMRDLTNLELYKTKEASQLAEYYTKIIKNWSRSEKQQLYATTAPFFGVPGKEMSALGFPDIKGAMEFKDFARKYGGKYQATQGTIDKTAAELAGTIFDPTSPLRRQGIALKLPFEKEIEVGGIKVGKEAMEAIPTRQIYLPALETYRGILKDPALVTGETAAYVGKLERAHERLFLALATENPDRARVEKLAKQYYNTLGSAFGGKKGLINYLTTARMAHSGYFGLVPGGEGALAKKMGTALENPFISHISETSAKQLGIYDILNERGSIYGRVSAYPGIGPTMESVLQFKMVKDTELGAKRLRISNLVALSMFRDFDADKAGVTFLTGERAQELSKQFYQKTVVPRLKWYERVMADDPELASIMAEESPLMKQTAQEIRSARQASKADLMGYGKAIALADAKTAKLEGSLADHVARKYTTKALTGPVNWYLTQFRILAEQPAIQKDMLRLGLPRTNMKMVGGVLGLLEQQAAITKGKEVAGGVQGVFRLMSTRFQMDTEAGRKVYADAIDEGANYLRQLAGTSAEMTGDIKEARAIASGLSGRGEYRWLATHDRRRAAMRQLLNVGQVRMDALAKMKAGGNVYTKLMRHMSSAPKVEHGFQAWANVYMDIAERQAALSGDMSALNAASEKVVQAAGITKSAGMEWGTDIAGLEARAARAKVEHEAMKQVNQQAKVEGRAVGMTVLDRASQWWTRAETPMWQKAGVITGAAIILGSVAKNTLFPGYGGSGRTVKGPAAPVGPPPVIIAAPPIGGGYQGPTGPPVAPHAAHKKPGGLWAYVQEQIGFGPESYGIDVGRGQMPLAKPVFGPRRSMPGMGLDVGPGIADSDSRPMILTGPPVGGGAPLPPAVPSVERAGPEIPYTTPQQEPPARMMTPEHMRPGMMVSALQPPMGGMPTEDIEGIMRRQMGGEVNMVVDRWDPADGMIDRMVDSSYGGMSSFT